VWSFEPSFLTVVKQAKCRWLTLLAFAAMAGCADNSQSSKAPVRAFVAASTRDAVKEIADLFTQAKGIPVSINAEDSSKLAMQIMQDASGHIFLSANEQWANEVMDKGFGKESKVLLGNKLVIVAPKELAGKIKSPADLTKDFVKKVAVAGPTVPAGIYARQALEKLSLWEELEKQKRIVSGDNVRATLTYVELGEAEAGIVYATDAMISKRVEVAYHFDPSMHDPIRYPLVLLKSGAESPGAVDFFQFLSSAQAAAVFQRHGFTVMPDK